MGFEVIVFLVAFAGLAFSAEHLCNSMETLCDHWNIPEDVGGATFIALGGSIPEIAINCIATFKAVHSKSLSTSTSLADMGVGAILGSGMMAYLLIPGLSALFSRDNALQIRTRSIYRDATFYGLAVLTLMSALHSGLSVYHAPIMISIYICYVIVLVFSEHLHFWWSHAIGHPHLGPTRHRNDGKVVQSVFRERYSSIASPMSPTADDPLFAASVPLIPVDTDSSTVVGEDALIIPMNDDEDRSNDEEASAIKSAVYTVTWPLRFCIDLTCPDCRIFQPCEKFYPLTFIISFAWITLFSFIITVIVDRWVEILNMPSASAIFGLIIVAAGAEIPDAVNAVTISKRGFGSMAISACLGAQVINICIGLGLPWLILLIAGIKVPISSGNMFVHETSFFLFIDVLVFVIIAILGATQTTSLITYKKAIFLLGWYCLTVGYIVYSTTNM